MISKVLPDGSLHTVGSGYYKDHTREGALRIQSYSGPRLFLKAADGALLWFDWSDSRWSRILTCAPRSAPWASARCPESVWVRAVAAAVGGHIIGVTNSIEPQPRDAFLVTLDGHRFTFGAITADNYSRMGAYWTMGEFQAGMSPSGKVAGVPIFGNVLSGHWVWKIHGFTVEIYPDPADRTDHLSRSILSRLVLATKVTSTGR